MQVYSLCVFGTNLIESLKVPPYAYGNEGKRKHCMLRCGNGFSWLPSRDLSMQKYLRHMSVSCAIRWAGRRGSVLPSQAKTRSQILLRCDQLTAKACRTKILSIVGKGMGLSKGQDAMGYAKNGCKFALAPSDVPTHTWQCWHIFCKTSSISAKISTLLALQNCSSFRGTLRDVTCTF